MTFAKQVGNNKGKHHKRVTMSADTYLEVLDEMIALFQDYKPGSISLENITRLCQTLGLESFIDDVDADIARLSTASKIIVIDIDYNKRQNRVDDVKLVLASNFDNFNYFNDEPLGDDSSKNILLNTLTRYPTLHQFHSNLKYIHLLDTYSHIDMDASNSISTSSMNNDGVSSMSSAAVVPTSGSVNNSTGNFDLFKYFTELSQFLAQYFAANNKNFTVKANLNDLFGLYIFDNDHLLAKIYLGKSSDPAHRLYEYIFSTQSACWINESYKKHTSGVSLVLELVNLTGQDNIYFPADLIPKEVIIEQGLELVKSDGEGQEGAVATLMALLSSTANVYNEDIQIINDFTTSFIKVKKVDISNDNLDFILEILNWVQWSQNVLFAVCDLIKPFFDVHRRKKDLIAIQNPGGNGNIDSRQVPMRNISSQDVNMGSNTLLEPQEPIPRRRRSSARGKRPSLTEATMLKDEGLQQFNLRELMTEEQDESAIDIDMTGEESIAGTEKSNAKPELVLSEDHIMLNNIGSCSAYEKDHSQWTAFVEKLRKCIISR